MEVSGIDWSREQQRPGFFDGVAGEACPSRLILGHVSGKWGVLVLLGLSAGSRRWGELKRSIEGVSEKMLAQTLRTLEEDGLVRRDAQAVIPPRVDYTLTERGQELTALLKPLMSWIVANAADIIEEREQRAGADPTEDRRSA